LCTNTHSWLKYYAIYQHPELGLLWEQKCTGSVLLGIPDCAQQRDLYGNVSIENVFLGQSIPKTLFNWDWGLIIPNMDENNKQAWNSQPKSIELIRNAPNMRYQEQLVAAKTAQMFANIP
jgi:hypothetical protein